MGERARPERRGAERRSAERRSAPRRTSALGESRTPSAAPAERRARRAPAASALTASPRRPAAADHAAPSPAVVERRLLLLATSLLLLYGLVMAYSASARAGVLRPRLELLLLRRQLVFAVAGVAAMIALSRIDFAVWRRLSGLLYAGAMALMRPRPGPGHRHGDPRRAPLARLAAPSRCSPASSPSSPSSCLLAAIIARRPQASARRAASCASSWSASCPSGSSSGCCRRTWARRSSCASAPSRSSSPPGPAGATSSTLALRRRRCSSSASSSPSPTGWSASPPSSIPRAYAQTSGFQAHAVAALDRLGPRLRRGPRQLGAEVRLPAGPDDRHDHGDHRRGAGPGRPARADRPLRLPRLDRLPHRAARAASSSASCSPSASAASSSARPSSTSARRSAWCRSRACRSPWSPSAGPASLVVLAGIGILLNIATNRRSFIVVSPRRGDGPARRRRDGRVTCRRRSRVAAELAGARRAHRLRHHALAGRARPRRLRSPHAGAARASSGAWAPCGRTRRRCACWRPPRRVRWRILRETRPAAAVGGGGYASGPVVALAGLRGIPALALEADAHLGVTNRLLRPFVDRFCLSFPIEGLGPPKYVVTGRPLAASQLAATREQGLAAFELRRGPPRAARVRRQPGRPDA